MDCIGHPCITIGSLFISRPNISFDSNAVFKKFVVSYPDYRYISNGILAMLTIVVSLEVVSNTGLDALGALVSIRRASNCFPT